LSAGTAGGLTCSRCPAAADLKGFMFNNIVSKYKRRLLKEAIKHLFRRNPDSYKAIFLDYPVNPAPRYGFGHEPHERITEILNRNKRYYSDLLNQFIRFTTDIELIPLEKINETDPYWNNGFFPALDSLSLYSIIALMRPDRYFEVGSGHSTKFARRAIKDHKLNTRIICIDPKPRAEIDAIADEVIYSPLETVNPNIFSVLEKNDILFVDGSHRCFMNSDVTAVFLDVLPELKSGVLVHFHDIFLPFDYPSEMKEYFYSEQYLLAVMLLSTVNPDVVFPSFFVQNDRELMNILRPITGKLSYTSFHGGSFWIRK
jgi:hypothetical protein